MAKNREKPPFLKSVEHLQALHDIDFTSALESVQNTYSRFKERNQKLIERQNDQSNSAQVQLISHFALLATLTLTVVGFLLTQTSHELTDNQKLLIVAILVAEVISLGFGAWDYLQTILFHQRWAKLYQDIDKETDSKLESGGLQWTYELNDIEAKHLKRTPESTRMWVTFVMVGFCLAGLLLLVLVFCAYFYDIPLVK
jgi:hypothetical protein